MSEGTSEKLPACKFCGSEPDRFIQGEVLHVKCPLCNTVHFATHVRFGCLADAQWTEEMSEGGQGL